MLTYKVRSQFVVTNVDSKLCCQPIYSNGLVGKGLMFELSETILFRKSRGVSMHFLAVFCSVEAMFTRLSGLMCTNSVKPQRPKQ